MRLGIFLQRGLDQSEFDSTSSSQLFDASVSDITSGGDGKNLQKLHESLSYPKYPVNIGSEQSPEIAPKLQLEPGTNNSAELYIEPNDLKGHYVVGVCRISQNPCRNQ